VPLPTVLRARVRWILIGWMFAISAIAYLDRVNISIAGSLIQEDFHLTDIQLGWVFSAFVLGYALSQAPGGRTADRFGPRRVITVGTVWWAAFTAFTAWAPPNASFSLALLLALRFLLGVGEAVVYPASNRLLATWFPSQERGTANGFIFAGVGAGAGVAPPLITWINTQFGWHWSFWVSAIIGLGAGAVWLYLTRDTPDEHPWITPEENAHIKAGLPVKTEAHKPLPWAAIFTNRDVIALTISYSTFGYVAYIFFSWFFIYLVRVRGLNLRSSAWYGMLPFIAMALGSPLGGVIGDWLTKHYGKRIGRCGTGMVGLALAGIFVALGTQAHDARLASLVLAGGAGALYLSTSSFWSVTSDIGGVSAGSVSGVMNMGNQLCGALTATVTPMIAARYGWTASFLVAASVCAAGSLAWLAVDPNQAIAREQGEGARESELLKGQERRGERA
jgi:MFS transporter, ACS family, glucarate transporter